VLAIVLAFVLSNWRLQVSVSPRRLNETRMSSELSTNQEIEGLFDELFSFPRSITGDCQTLFLQDLRDLHASCLAK